MARSRIGLVPQPNSIQLGQPELARLFSTQPLCSLRGASVTLSNTLRCGNRLKCWKTIPMRCRKLIGVLQHRAAVEQDVAAVGS